MSVLDLILPEHARVTRYIAGVNRPKRETPNPEPGTSAAPFLTGDGTIDDALIACVDMAREGDWRTVQHLGEAIAHRAKILRYEATCDAAGVVRH